MIEKIKRYVEEHKMLQKEDCVITGVSGGADSVCLLFVLLKLQELYGFDLAVVHVNHQLRGADADGDERFVQQLCEENHVKFISYRENIELLAKKWKQSTEEAGRNFRRQCFEEAAKTVGGTKIALAHHKNDSAETFFMNLARGAGLRGLGGIAPVQGNIIRPLLCLERNEIETYLQEQGIDYCTDATNASDVYTRNRVRNHLIPFMEEALNERTVAHMEETMAYLRAVNEYLEAQAEEFEKQCLVTREDGYILEKEAYCSVPEVVRPLIIKRLLAKVSGREKDLEASHVKAVEQLMEKQVGKSVDLPYNMEAKRNYQGILIRTKKDDKTANTIEVYFEPGKEEYQLGEYHITCRLLDKNEIENSSEKSGTKWYDYDIIDNGISFRMRCPGDYITIHEDGRSQKLKAYFINEKIPQEIRDEILLIADGNHILSIWGHRENCAYKVKKHTKTVLEIKVDKGEESWQKQLKY